MENQKNTKATVSLVLGIIGILWGLLLILGPIVATVFGIIAIVLGAQGRKEPVSTGRATAGLVLGIFSVIVGIGTIILNLVL